VAEDPYKLLGVPRDATPEAIKAAYRKLARKHHPDLNPGKPEAEERFKAVSVANELLSDPERRARFDRGEIDAGGQENAPPDPSYRRYAEEEAGARYGQRRDAETYEDLFADIFEARRRAEAAPRRGPDEFYRLVVPFLHAVQGATEQLTLPDGRVLDLVFMGRGLTVRQQAVPVNFRVNEPPADAPIGISVLVTLRTARAVQGIVLPADAVVRSAEGPPVVFEHATAERFIPRQVRVQPLDGTRVVVTAGLEAGQRVVVQGAALIAQVR
jgi:hypothetical protein